MGIELIFGGCFDPVHQGHINVICSLKNAFPNWNLRLMPCAIPALKSATSASFEQRVIMLELATKSIKNIMIDQRENDRKGKSYTLDSLKSLQSKNPTRKRVLVVGTDTLISMNRWYGWQELSQYCHLVLVNRPGHFCKDTGKLMKRLGFTQVKKSHGLEKNNYGDYYCLNIEEKDISSSEVRAHLLSGLSVENYISKNVFEYIVKNRIYQ